MASRWENFAKILTGLRQSSKSGVPGNARIVLSGCAVFGAFAMHTPRSRWLHAGSKGDEELRREARSIFDAGCKAVDPKVAILNAMKLRGVTLAIAGEALVLSEFDEIIVLGTGKAGVGMVEGVEYVLQGKVTKGIVVTKYEHSIGHTLSSKIEVFEADHPTPDEAGVLATSRLLEMVSAAGPKSLVLCCISGGSSALLVAPVKGVTLAEKKEATSQLLACGCPIEAKNAVLTHLSCVKGGQLLRAARPAKVMTMILSDVVGDPLHAIGSGPTVPDVTTFADCLKILEDYHVKESFPKSCLNHLVRGARGEVPDTPKQGDTIFQGSLTTVVAGNKTAVDAALEKASLLGYNTLALSTFMEGEAAEVAKTFSALAKEQVAYQRPLSLPACIVGGGETTVTLPAKPGIGGRNQILALSAALQIQGLTGVALLAGGTDGGDGPKNDAAGAVVTGSDVMEAKKAGLDAQAYLERCDSYSFFVKFEEAKYGRHNVMHLRNGLTGTNVADLTVLLVC